MVLAMMEILALILKIRIVEALNLIVEMVLTMIVMVILTCLM